MPRGEGRVRTHYPTRELSSIQQVVQCSGAEEEVAPVGGHDYAYATRDPYAPQRTLDMQDLMGGGAEGRVKWVGGASKVILRLVTTFRVSSQISQLDTQEA